MMQTSVTLWFSLSECCVFDVHVFVETVLLADPYMSAVRFIVGGNFCLNPASLK